MNTKKIGEKKLYNNIRKNCLTSQATKFVVYETKIQWRSLSLAHLVLFHSIHTIVTIQNNHSCFACDTCIPIIYYLDGHFGRKKKEEEKGSFFNFNCLIRETFI